MCRAASSSTLYPDNGHLFYITYVLLPPILLGIGLIANLLLLLLVGRQYLRCISPVYVYFATIAAIDLLALIGTVPAFVRELGIFPLEVTHGPWMAYSLWLHAAIFQSAFRQAVGWLTAAMGTVRTVEILKSSSNMQTTSKKRSRWTRLSANRILAFVIVVFCLLMNLPRLFDTVIVPPHPDCPRENAVWTHNITRLALSSRLNRDIIPVIASFLGHVIPLAICILFAILIAYNVPRGRIGRDAVVMRTPGSRDEAEFQVSVCVFTTLITLVVLELITSVLTVLRAFFYRPGVTAEPPWLYQATMIAHCLSNLRCTLNFLILSLINHDFRKTFWRTFCCCVSVGDADQYYEPVRCCSCVCNEKFEERYRYDESRGQDERNLRKKYNKNGRLCDTYDAYYVEKNESLAVPYSKYYDDEKAIWI